jgi:rare lipoprotein A
MKYVITLSLCLLITSCATGRYKQKHDSAPIRPPTQMELLDAQVLHEPVGRGNNPYVVFGKHYTPMKKRMPYKEKGVASWYGKKFHGHLTSNGEVYNMYGMSAAHKTLPLPSYVKVTNLKNNKSVVVRVNDRGPFHESRIIDLSYSAAVKIGVFDTGTAKVKIETILPPPLAPQYQVVITGFNSNEEVKETATGLSHLLHIDPALVDSSQATLLRLGPYHSDENASAIAKSLIEFGYSDAKVETLTN